MTFELIYTQHLYALTCLVGDDLAAYQDVCRSMWDRFDRSESANEVDFAIWTVVLSPNGMGGPDAVLAAARRIAGKSPKKFLSMRTLGAALYRAGLIEEAIECLDEVSKLAVADRCSTAYIQFFLAMAHCSDGNLAEAEAAVDQVADWVAQALGEKQPPTAATLDWNKCATLALLRREAQSLLAVAIKAP